MQPIKTYIINLPDRLDRREHIQKQFSGRPEFDVEVVPAIRDEVGSWGLWQTIKDVIGQAVVMDDEFVIFCEDDHTFTADYSKELLWSMIRDARELKAEMILGGASWFENVLPITKHLFWVNKFNGLQFTVVFRKFYTKILSATMTKGMEADIFISQQTSKCFICFPYLSVQKEFGYSDITQRNAERGYITDIFNNRLEVLKNLHRVAMHYRKFI